MPSDGGAGSDGIDDEGGGLTMAMARGESPAPRPAPAPAPAPATPPMTAQLMMNVIERGRPSDITRESGGSFGRRKKQGDEDTSFGSFLRSKLKNPSPQSPPSTSPSPPMRRVQQAPPEKRKPSEDEPSRPTAQRKPASRADDEAEASGLAAWTGWAAFRRRRYVFDHDAWQHQAWDWLLMLPTTYTAVFLPIVLVFPAAQWRGALAFDAVLDSVFFCDVLIKLRTSFTERGQPVFEPDRVRRHYIRSWCVPDLVSSCFPLGIVFAVTDIDTNGSLYRQRESNPQSPAPAPNLLTGPGD